MKFTIANFHFLIQISVYVYFIYEFVWSTYIHRESVGNDATKLTY